MTVNDPRPEPDTACEEDISARPPPRDDRTMTKHDIS